MITHRFAIGAGHRLRYPCGTLGVGDIGEASIDPEFKLAVIGTSILTPLSDGHGIEFGRTAVIGRLRIVLRKWRSHLGICGDDGLVHCGSPFPFGLL